MKTILKTKIAFLFILIGLTFSCKTNESKSADSTYDSIQQTIDTVGPEVDTIMDDTIVTTATEMEGSTEKGTGNTKTDSVMKR